jgi:hypothetical protein
MRDVSRRLLALEIQRLRRMAAEGGAPYGFDADTILDALIDFLQRPREQQKRDCPGYTDVELDWLESRLSLYRQARCYGSAKGRR